MEFGGGPWPRTIGEAMPRRIGLPTIEFAAPIFEMED